MVDANNMNPILLHRNSAVLLVLILLTLVSWYLAMSQEAIEVSQWSGVAMLFVAFVKVRLIIRNFMEVRGAPFALKVCGDVWVVLASILTVSAYLGLFPVA